MKKKCEACGYARALQAHHIDQDNSNNEPENIQTLCKHCHDFWHTTAKRIGKMVAGRMPRLA
ncbi:MAG: HNH endonuclease [Burkholderiales bacterium]|nr:HNH endonuclease [Burkholderiales bacterium]